MSSLTSIYDAIAGITVTANGKTPNVRNYDELKENFEASDAPTRMMTVVTGPTEGREGIFIALGKAQRITWVIEDRCYWTPVAHGHGLLDYSGKLVPYMAAYAEAVRDNRSPTSQSHITNVRMIPAIVRWPDHEKGTPYAGVRCILEIEEFVLGA